MKLPVYPLLGAAINAPDMRSLNGIQLLNLICENGPVSRAALAKLSGLSKPAVSEQVGRLIASGAVVERGTAQAGESGGKPPTLLEFHADIGRVAGIAIGSALTHITVTDFRGNHVSAVEIPTAPDQSPRRLIGRIERVLAAIVSRSGRSLNAIAIGVPGRVDSTSGTVLESGGVLGWNQVDLRTPFRLRFGCSVSVDNDVNAGLLAELHRGGARNARTAVLIRSGTGIGSAIAIDRRIHHGSHWAAGEIGHLAASLSAARKRVPGGHLEWLLGADKVTRRIQSAASRSPLLRKLSREVPAIQALAKAAGMKDVVACELARELTGVAAIAVASQVLAYDPDVVLLSGELLVQFLPDIRKSVARTVPWASNIQAALFGDEGVQAGAIEMAMISAYDQMARDLSADSLLGRRLAAGA